MVKTKSRRNIYREYCLLGIAIDNKRLIYISDTDKHQVRKYKIGEKME